MEMKHTEILTSAVTILKDRALQYGPEEACFDRISSLASIILNKEISPYDVAIIQVCVKLGRLQEARTLKDNYIDTVNYIAFAAQFATGISSVQTAVSEDIKNLVDRLAPATRADSIEPYIRAKKKPEDALAELAKIHTPETEIHGPTGATGAE